MTASQANSGRGSTREALVSRPKDTISLVNKLHEQKGITVTHEQIEGADHFFKDDEHHMKPMIDTVSTYVKRRLGEVSR